MVSWVVVYFREYPSALRQPTSTTAIIVHSLAPVFALLRLTLSLSVGFLCEIISLRGLSSTKSTLQLEI